METSKIEARMAELTAERTVLIASRVEDEAMIAEREQRRSLALSRITGINGAIEELQRVIDGAKAEAPTEPPEVTDDPAT